MQGTVQSFLNHSGNRSYARLRLAIPAEMELTHGIRSCLLDNLSRSGARVRAEAPPKVGSSVILKFADFEAFAMVVWVQGIQCGLLFDEQLTQDAMQQLRWISENHAKYQRAQMQGVARDWSQGES
jgi:hypothetical protein